jgi:lysophospholipase L1-like esterase
MHIAALGSSFAAGPSIAPQTSAAARRSGNNYASLLSRSLPGSKLTDLSSSGATLLNVLSEPQETLLATLPPQLEGLPSDADIVTITAGGNDMGYSAGMLGDAARLTIDDRELLGMMLEAMGLKKDAAAAGPAADGVVGKKEVAARFVAVIDAVRARAPKAKIFLVEYLAVFGPDTAVASDQPLGEERVAFYRGLVRELKEAYRDAAGARKDSGVEVVSFADLSEQGRAMGSKEPWVMGFTAEGLMVGGTPFHPNAEGHKGVAEVLAERVRATMRVAR